jgi:hypothetical protein
MRLLPSNNLRLFPIFILILPAIFVMQVFIFRPYFGNMDDSNLLILAANSDPISYSHSFGWRPGAGFIQYTSMLITWPVYALGSAFGPTAFFVANALLTFTIILFAAHALTKLLNICTPVTILTFVSTAFLWPYTVDLLFFPSLQEKGVILGAALLFFWIHFTRTQRSVSVFWFSFLLTSSIAFATKTHIVLFVPAVVAALWMVSYGQRASNSASRLIIATTVLIVLSLGTLWLALVGGYSSGTQGTRDVSFLFDRRFQILVVLAVSYSAYLAYRAVRATFIAIHLVPFLIVVPFIASFSTWTVRNYYLTVVSIGVAAMAAVIVANLKSKHVGPIVGFFCLVLAVTWVAFRVPQIYPPLASVQVFLLSAQAHQLAQQKEVVGVSCMEAPTHFNRYAIANGVANLEFNWIGALPDKFEFVLGDERLCPFSADAVGWKVQWQSPVEGGYSLYRNNNYATS